MSKVHRIAIVGSLLAIYVSASVAQAESCDQIRIQIKAQVGLLAKPDTGLLQKLGARQECRFTAPEVYRAAYGDKPMPANVKERRRAKEGHHDDD